MAYSPKGVMDIYQIIARWHTGYSVSEISRTLEIDRKTVRRYVRAAVNQGLTRDGPLPTRSELTPDLIPLVTLPERPRPAQNQFEPYREEILDLVGRPTDRLKAKTVYEVLCHRYTVLASYSSFKRYFRQIRAAETRRSTCRIETDPGQEIQVDYAKMSTLFDPITGRRRNVYAFIGILSSCRYKYVEFVHMQDQRSFVASHVRMFEFFGGVTKCVMIDNLKAGVIKPDLYEPTLNPLYREMAEHYHTFIDPARIRSPKDKGKVERAVPLVRELFLKLKTLHKNLDLPAANVLAKQWCRDENGMRVHGTTGEKPAVLFLESEKDALIPLPETRFEMATWKEVHVHPDQYIQFEKQAYGVPERYVGARLWARGDDTLLRIYDSNFELVRKHVRTNRYRHTDWSDFPNSLAAMMDDQGVKRLLAAAGRIGPSMQACIREVLEPHARINLRKAQGMLGRSKKYTASQMEEAAKRVLAGHASRYKAFKYELEQIAQEVDDPDIPISDDTITRDASYFIHSNPV